MSDDHIRAADSIIYTSGIQDRAFVLASKYAKSFTVFDLIGLARLSSPKEIVPLFGEVEVFSTCAVGERPDPPDLTIQHWRSIQLASHLSQYIVHAIDWIDTLAGTTRKYEGYKHLSTVHDVLVGVMLFRAGCGNDGAFSEKNAKRWYNISGYATRHSNLKQMSPEDSARRPFELAKMWCGQAVGGTSPPMFNIDGYLLDKWGVESHILSTSKGIGLLLILTRMINRGMAAERERRAQPSHEPKSGNSTDPFAGVFTYTMLAERWEELLIDFSMKELEIDMRGDIEYVTDCNGRLYIKGNVGEIKHSTKNTKSQRDRGEGSKQLRKAVSQLYLRICAIMDCIDILSTKGRGQGRAQVWITGNIMCRLSDGSDETQAMINNHLIKLYEAMPLPNGEDYKLFINHICK